MPLERPCSPGHCLGMLNEYIRTDILRRVHQAIHARLDQRGTRSPLLILIESLEDVLGIFAGDYHMEGIRPNHFNSDPHYCVFTRGFCPEMACQYDLALLQSQLEALRGFCQVVEAETLIRQAGASLRSYPPFRRPAPYPRSHPNSRSGFASLGGTPTPTADAAGVGSVGQWGHTPIESAAHGQEI